MESKDIIKILRVNKKLTQKEVSDAVRKLAKFYRISTDKLLGMKDFSYDPLAILPLDDYEKSMMINVKERDEFMRLVKKLQTVCRRKKTPHVANREAQKGVCHILKINLLLYYSILSINCQGGILCRFTKWKAKRMVCKSTACG